MLEHEYIERDSDCGADEPGDDHDARADQREVTTQRREPPRAGHVT